MREAAYLVKLNDDRLASSGSLYSTLKIWELETGKCIQTLTDRTGTFTCLVQLTDGHVASSSRGGTIKIWDLTSGKCMQTLTGHTGLVLCLTLLANGCLASGSLGGRIKIWK